jgi:pilus assembly protein CpaC
VNWDTAQPGTGPGSDGLNKGEATLKAFERVGLLRTLAEPNLTSVNGEAASFLAGGEFPVPASRDSQGQITVQYKPYGVGLSFRPVVLSGGRISLQVKVEVSELSSQGGLTIGAGTPSSITLPGLTVRRSENTIEIPSGGSMMIAGLLQENSRQTVDSLPGVTNLPVLGSLFRSRDYLMGETELVVIVEPYIVSPTSPSRMQTPADGLRIAEDSQTILFGQLNQVYGLPNAPPAGSVGYVIE